jgi:hypothetical protein
VVHPSVLHENDPILSSHTAANGLLYYRFGVPGYWPKGKLPPFSVGLWAKGGHSMLREQIYFAGLDHCF